MSWRGRGPGVASDQDVFVSARSANMTVSVNIEYRHRAPPPQKKKNIQSKTIMFLVIGVICKATIRRRKITGWVEEDEALG